MASPGDVEQRLEGELTVDGAGGLLGWGRRAPSVVQEIQAALTHDAVVEIDGTRLLLYASSTEGLERARASTEGVLTGNRVGVRFRVSRRDGESGEWLQADGAMVGRAPVLISTMNDLPGYETVEVYGEVFGLTVRTRNLLSRWGADVKSLVGGELGGMTKLLASSRDEVTERVRDEARRKGANAILAFRFDSSEIGEHWTEICAYGTAVRVRRLAEPPAATAEPRAQS